MLSLRQVSNSIRQHTTDLHLEARTCCSHHRLGELEAEQQRFGYDDQSTGFLPSGSWACRTFWGLQECHLHERRLGVPLARRQRRLKNAYLTFED